MPHYDLPSMEKMNLDSIIDALVELRSLRIRVYDLQFAMLKCRAIAVHVRLGTATHAIDAALQVLDQMRADAEKTPDQSSSGQS